MIIQKVINSFSKTENFGKITKAALKRIKERNTIPLNKMQVHNLTEKFIKNKDFILDFEEPSKKFKLYSINYFTWTEYRDFSPTNSIKNVLSGLTKKMKTLKHNLYHYAKRPISLEVEKFNITDHYNK